MSALLIVACLGLLQVSHAIQDVVLEDRERWPDVEEYMMVTSPEVAPVVLGWMGREFMADINWIRTLIYYGSSSIGRSSFRYLNKLLDNVIVLDPKFKRVYGWAGQAVVWKAARATYEEFETSVKYLEKGVEAFPNDFEMLRSLGLRYWLDLRADTEEERQAHREKGSQYIERAMRVPGAPLGAATLAASLRTKMGQRERAIEDLREMILATEDTKIQKQLLVRYRQMLDKPADADELEAFKNKMVSEMKTHLPYGPPALYLILGPPPSKRVDLEAVAPVRDLFGSEDLPADADNNSADADGTP
jgi:tetratricopeptide (TPR) repeat protein